MPRAWTSPTASHPLFARGLELLGYDPFERLAEGTRFQQPALFLCSVAAWEQWRAEDGEAEGAPVAAAGHSLGEYAALVAAGALAFEDAVALVDERAAAMARGRASWSRAGWSRCSAATPARCARWPPASALTVANDNAPGQVVLSGALDDIEQAEQVARDETGARARRLVVGGAFHSPLMEPAAARLARGAGPHARAHARDPRLRQRHRRAVRRRAPRAGRRTCCARCAGARRCWRCAPRASSASSSSGPGQC